MKEGNNYPFYEVLEGANAEIAKGHTIHQKFTCAKCGERQTMETPNVFFKTGKCEECSHITDIEADGCNYLVHIKLTGDKHDPASR